MTPVTALRIHSRAHPQVGGVAANDFLLTGERLGTSDPGSVRVRPCAGWSSKPRAVPATRWSSHITVPARPSGPVGTPRSGRRSMTGRHQTLERHRDPAACQRLSDRLQTVTPDRDGRPRAKLSRVTNTSAAANGGAARFPYTAPITDHSGPVIHTVPNLRLIAGDTAPVSTVVVGLCAFTQSPRPQETATPVIQ